MRVRATSVLQRPCPHRTDRGELACCPALGLLWLFCWIEQARQASLRSVRFGATSSARPATDVKRPWPSTSPSNAPSSKRAAHHSFRNPGAYPFSPNPPAASVNQSSSTLCISVRVVLGAVAVSCTHSMSSKSCCERGSSRIDYWVLALKTARHAPHHAANPDRHGDRREWHDACSQSSRSAGPLQLSSPARTLSTVPVSWKGKPVGCTQSPQGKCREGTEAPCQLSLKNASQGREMTRHASAHLPQCSSETCTPQNDAETPSWPSCELEFSGRFPVPLSVHEMPTGQAPYGSEQVGGARLVLRGRPGPLPLLHAQLRGQVHRARVWHEQNRTARRRLKLTARVSGNTVTLASLLGETPLRT